MNRTFPAGCPGLVAGAVGMVTVLMNLESMSSLARGATFGEDLAFLRRHGSVVLLKDRAGQAQVAVSPAWQGRVMTSTATGDGGLSFGWINRELIQSGQLQKHINVFGGEDRFWLGPEGGQYSIFFAKGAPFQLSDWHTPPPIDTMPYEPVKQTDSAASFRAVFAVTNYSGTRFDLRVDREIRLLGAGAAAGRLGVRDTRGLNVVAYESVNKITNVGTRAWEKASGLLSVWILGMFNPSPATTIVVPIKPGPESSLGGRVTSDYFGPVPADRLVVREDALFFSGDGMYRSKIGVSPQRSTGVLGSYDAVHRVLTLVQFTQPAGVTEYVNSQWKIQDKPYGGDAVNSYNDGPPSPGAKPLGPFYELESSSPAAALKPGRALTHVHRTIHATGDDAALDALARKTLGVSILEIREALPGRSRVTP